MRVHAHKCACDAQFTIHDTHHHAHQRTRHPLLLPSAFHTTASRLLRAVEAPQLSLLLRLAYPSRYPSTVTYFRRLLAAAPAFPVRLLLAALAWQAPQRPCFLRLAKAAPDHRRCYCCSCGSVMPARSRAGGVGLRLRLRLRSLPACLRVAVGGGGGVQAGGGEAAMLPAASVFSLAVAGPAPCQR